MWSNDFLLGFRHIARQKFNAALHIIGLTLGMSVCLLIALFLRYESGFDTFHDKASRTYRLNSVWTESGVKSYHYSTPMPLASVLRNSTTGIENVSLAHPLEKAIIDIGPQKRFLQDHILIVEPDFLDIFNVESVAGDPYATLRQPYQALLTESTAKKFFGKESPIGKSFRLRNEFDITVTGIIRDFPPTTHLPVSMLLSFVPNEKYLRNGVTAWTYVSGTETFVTLKPGTNPSALSARLKKIADDNINADPHNPKFSRSDFDLLPLTDIHFTAKYGELWVQSVNPTWLWFFALIGLGVLFLACINFMNLSIAQALTRAREVGVRKSVGAGRFRLIRQFLTEAWIFTLIAGVLAVIATQAALPALNTLLAKEIIFKPLTSPSFLAIMAAGIIATGVLAGIYPAWVISTFNPASTLKAGAMTAGDHKSSWFRRTLLVTQFTISIGLLIAVVLVARQVNFLRTRDLGFDKENVVNIDLPDSRKAPALAGLLGNVASIKDISFSTSTPSDGGHWGTVVSRIARNDPNRQRMTLFLADDHFAKMYNLRLKAGRFLESPDTSLVSKAVPENDQIIRAVVNEKLVRTLAFKSDEEAIGQRIWIGFNSGRVEIVGVVADFNTGPLHEGIAPTLITQDARQYGQAGIKIQAHANVPQTIAAIEDAWKKTFPQGLFEFRFLDDKIDAFYKAEARLYTLFKIFAGMAMLISCLGLWGLSAITAQQRTKEIGIRKVLGASVSRLVRLLATEFIVQVLLALLIASPLAYYLVQDWLTHFAYHVDIEWLVFVAAGFSSVAVTLLTVSVQAMKAALANPVQSLRTE
jgi:putative ABC transport system permease protein